MSFDHVFAHTCAASISAAITQRLVRESHPYARIRSGDRTDETRNRRNMIRSLLTDSLLAVMSNDSMEPFHGSPWTRCRVHAACIAIPVARKLERSLGALNGFDQFSDLCRLVAEELDQAMLRYSMLRLQKDCTVATAEVVRDEEEV